MAARRASRKSSRMVNPIARRPFDVVTIVVPFKHLVPDNAKHMAIAMRTKGGKVSPRMVLTPRYRAAKEAIQAVARRAMQDTNLATEDVALHAKLYVPDKRRRDASNLCKICHDCLTGIVLDDDSQIKVATWENAGLDRENPRAEITVRAK